MSRLPQELIDHIIDHVHDRESLKSCSLVCSQWSSRSRKYLFVQVDFTSIRDLQRWCTRIRSGPSGLSSLVESLSLTEYYPSSTLPSPSWLHPPILSNASSHFQSFSGLRALWILRWRMSTDRVLSMLHSFGSSLGNVTQLTLGHITAHPSTLAMFVSHFPRLDDLFISADDLRHGTGGLDRGFHVDIVPTHPCGKFSTSGVFMLFQPPKAIFEGIILLEPRFRQVSLAHVSYYAWRDYWPLAEACGGSLEELHILADVTDADCDGLSLGCCPNLRKIALSLGHEQPARPCQFVEKCLSTITSTQLSEVSFRLLHYFSPPGSNLALWDPLDIILYNLSGKYRPRYEGDKMMVELVGVTPDPFEAGDFLWRYRQRGTWRVKPAI